MNDFIPKFEEVKCQRCNRDGYIFTSTSAKKCSCREDFEQELRVINRMLNSNLLSSNSSKEEYLFTKNFSFTKYVGKDIENIRKLEKFTSEFTDKFSAVNLYLWGTYGTQKTTQSKFILYQLLKQNKTVYYIQTKTLIDYLMRSDREDEIRVLLDKILNVDCLVLDEFSAPRLALYKSGYKEKVLLPFLKTRLESIHKATIFISNDPVEKLSELDEVIKDLVERETLVGKMEFKDRYVDNMKPIDLNSIWD